MILSRCVSKGVLKRICKGVYLFSKEEADSSIVIYKTASKLRDGFINYISLETVLCEESVISQQLPGWVTIMTTGRSGIINCGNFGTIEVVHTAKDISKINSNLYLDSKSKMLKANVEQAYKDMIFAKRKSVDLIDFSELENWRKEHECI